MNFADGMKEIIRNLDPILSLSGLLTPKTIESIEKVSSIDWENIALMIDTHNEMIKNMDKIETVSNGLDSIKAVQKNQNYIQYVSNIRESIGVVAVNIEDIKAVQSLSSSIIKCNGMEPDLKDILTMKKDIEEVLDMKDEIDATNFIAMSMRDDMFELEKKFAKASADKLEIGSMLKKIEDAEERIEQRYQETLKMEKNLENFNVSVSYVENDVEPVSTYDKERGILHLQLPAGKTGPKGTAGESGKQGERGAPGSVEFKGLTGDTGASGRDGKDFAATAYGTKAERSRYNNNPPGTSYVVLDEIPAMVYFRIGNSSGNWTSGQPFGVTDGLTAGTADNAERLNGYTAQDLIQFIQRKLKE